MVGFLRVILTSYFVPVQLVANGANATTEGGCNISDTVAIASHGGNLITVVLA